MRKWFWLFWSACSSGSDRRGNGGTWILVRRILQIMIVLAVSASIAWPARAAAPATYLRGLIGSTTGLAVSTPYEFQDFRPPRNAESIVFYFRTTRGGTLRIERTVPEYALPTVTQRVIPDITIASPPPADEYVIVIDAAPLGNYRVTFINAAVGTANISLEATWKAGSATGPQN